MNKASRPQVTPWTRKWGGDFVQHFARTQARELGAHGLHLPEHLLGALGRGGLALAALVEALAAHAVALAAALGAQGFVGPQAANGRRKDFFGNGMPWSSSTTCRIVRSDKFRPWASFNSLAAKRFCSRNGFSNRLMRCSGVGSTAGAPPEKVGPAA